MFATTARRQPRCLSLSYRARDMKVLPQRSFRGTGHNFKLVASTVEHMSCSLTLYFFIFLRTKFVLAPAVQRAKAEPNPRSRSYFALTLEYHDRRASASAATATGKGATKRVMIMIASTLLRGGMPILCSAAIVIFAAVSGADARETRSAPAHSTRAGVNPPNKAVGRASAGRDVFRFETFGNEGFWTDAMRMPKGVLDAKVTRSRL